MALSFLFSYLYFRRWERDEGSFFLLGRIIINRIVCEAIKGTTINDDNLNDPRFDALWEKASELDFCFFIHPWDMQRGGCHEAFWSPWLTGNGELISRLYISIFEALRLANHKKECLKELLMQRYV